MNVVNEIKLVKGLTYVQEAVFIAYAKALMKDKGITIADLAKITGYQVKYLDNFAFTHYCSAPLRLAIADVLEIDLQKIVDNF